MKATKLFLMIACGMGAINTNAELSQESNQIKSPEVLIVNIWINGVDYHTETVTFSENGKRFVECEALSDIGIRVEKISRHLAKKDFCSLTQPGITVEDDYSLQAIKIFFPADFFVGTDYELEIEVPEKANFGGFVNYSLFYGKDEEDQEFNTFSEFGIFKDYWLFKNAFLYRNEPEETEQTFLRVNSTLDH